MTPGPYVFGPYGAEWRTGPAVAAPRERGYERIVADIRDGDPRVLDLVTIPHKDAAR